jgi:hypothetical protein
MDRSYADSVRLYRLSDSYSNLSVSAPGAVYRQCSHHPPLGRTLATCKHELSPYRKGISDVQKQVQDLECKPLRDLDFESSMRDTGIAWLPRDLFDWPGLHLHDDLVTSTSFTFNEFQGIFCN